MAAGHSSQNEVPFSLLLRYIQEYEVLKLQLPRLYMAQTQIFRFIPELRCDVGEPAGWDTFVPAASRLHVQINGWIGPPGTISPLHRDPYHNLFCQVLGRKYFRLYAPEEAHRLYPSQKRTQRNTSAVVDVRHPGPSFPGFAEVPYREAELGPGDMLYMPPHWWHYVEALAASASISFWYTLPKGGGAA